MVSLDDTGAGQGDGIGVGAPNKREHPLVNSGLPVATTFVGQ